MKLQVGDHIRVKGHHQEAAVCEGELVHIFKAFEQPQRKLVDLYYGENPPLVAYKPSTMNRIVVDCGNGTYFVTPITAVGRNELFEIIKLYSGIS